jgi:hypothetical protein
MSLGVIALVGAVVIGAALGVVAACEAVDDALRNRRRQRALDSFTTREDTWAKHSKSNAPDATPLAR